MLGHSPEIDEIKSRHLLIFSHLTPRPHRRYGQTNMKTKIGAVVAEHQGCVFICREERSGNVPKDSDADQNVYFHLKSSL